MGKQRIRPIRIDGNLAYVPLTQGHEAIIDAADAAFVGQWNWHAVVDRNTIYASRSVNMGNRRTLCIRMHRAILNAKAEEKVDHADGNGLNNTRSNIRIADASENAWNSRVPKNNASGFKGVHWHKPSKKWVASISAKGVSYHLGRFDAAEEAAVAYAEASARLHGAFGRADMPPLAAPGE